MKKYLPCFIIEFLFAVVFNFCFFILGNADKTPSEWIAYAFVHLALVMVTATPYFYVRSRDSYILNASVSVISLLYFIAVLLFGLAVISPDMVSFANLVEVSFLEWYVLLAQHIETMPPGSIFCIELVILLIYVALFIVIWRNNKETAELENSRQKKIGNLRSISDRLKVLNRSVSDTKLEKGIDHITDMIKSSPLSVGESAQEYEDIINDLIGGLEQAIRDEDTKTAASMIKDIEKNITLRNTVGR